MYGNVTLADAYWTARLYGSLWLMQSTTTKNQALQTASDRINNLPLEGTPDSDNDEGVHFPLDGEDAIPQAVLNATYELALCLIQNPPTGGGGSGSGNVKRAKIGPTETEFFGNVAPWVSAGIPCQGVWQLLGPYLCDPNELIIVRAS